MREQACKWRPGRASSSRKLERDEQSGLYTVLGLGVGGARSVLIATGVTNRRPPMDEELHDEALSRGSSLLPDLRRLRSHRQARGRDRGDGHGVAEAVFIRSYTADVTLIAPARPFA